MVRCAGGTLYTGYALDPTARTLAHNRGRGARYTASRRPVELVYVEPCRTKNQALRRELQLKRWTRARKEELIRRH
jgi:putative endonuclease